MVDITKCPPMKSFDDFETRLIDLMSALSSPNRAFDMYMRAKSGSVFNDYYDNPEKWTDDNLSTLADTILEQGKKDELFMRKAFPYMVLD